MENSSQRVNPGLQIMRMCMRKCAEDRNLNLKGDTVHHTIYECMEHCGSKWENAKGMKDMGYAVDS